MRETVSSSWMLTQHSRLSPLTTWPSMLLSNSECAYDDELMQQLLLDFTTSKRTRCVCSILLFHDVIMLLIFWVLIGITNYDNPNKGYCPRYLIVSITVQDLGLPCLCSIFQQSQRHYNYIGNLNTSMHTHAHAHAHTLLQQT